METNKSNNNNKTDTPPPTPPPTEPPLQRMSSNTSTLLSEPDADTSSPPRHPNNNKLPSSKFKGVVPQPNGRWGAQIYEKHRRVWLGTFNAESSAAAAYDIAAHRFRGRDAVTNSLHSFSDPELSFLSLHSKSEIVDMLRKHTYSDELRHFTPRGTTDSNHNKTTTVKDQTASTEQLFEKTVTPSDVGKLNRLVIPKQQAEKHFPIDGSGNQGMLMNFEDRNGKVWRFRYSYWNSSQSYVLTKGWSRFVKEKGLRAGDVVSFKKSKGDATGTQLYIDWKRVDGNVVAAVAPGFRLFGVDICVDGGDNVHVLKKRRLCS